MSSRIQDWMNSLIIISSLTFFILQSFMTHTLTATSRSMRFSVDWSYNVMYSAERCLFLAMSTLILVDLLGKVIVALPAHLFRCGSNLCNSLEEFCEPALSVCRRCRGFCWPWDVVPLDRKSFCNSACECKPVFDLSTVINYYIIIA